MEKKQLPRPLSSFIGRQGLLQILAHSLAGEARLVTLLGAPGIGKTRLALRFAETFSPRDVKGSVRGDAAHFCDLTEARTVADLCFAVSKVLGLRLPATVHDETISSYLADVFADR